MSKPWLATSGAKLHFQLAGEGCREDASCAGEIAVPGNVPAGSAARAKGSITAKKVRKVLRVFLMAI
jgi:hypothetical protein